MKFPLPASLKGLVTLIVLLALLPAMALIFYSGYARVHTDMATLSKAALRSARAIMTQQAQAVENTRILLMTLARLKEVRERDPEGSAVLFRNILLQTPVYANIRLLNVNGTTIASADPVGAELSGPAREAFTDALARPGFSVRVLPREQNSDSPLLNCQYPIRAHNSTPGVLLASLRITISPPELHALASQQIEHLHIVDKAGRIIFGYPSEDCEGSLEEYRHDQAWRRISASGGRGGYFRDEDGAHVVFEKLPAKESLPPDLTLILTISPNLLTEQTWKQIVQNVFLLSGALLVALLITRYLCHITLIAPIRRLLRAANSIKEGDLDTRIGVARLPQELQILAGSIDKMSSALANRDEELRTARDQANSGSQAKTDFLANMSHEIRTPMNAILGMTYLSRQGELTDQQRIYLDNIHSEADKLLLIINDILDFSKIEAGKFHIESIPFALHRLLEEVIASAREEAARKNIDFAAALPTDLPLCLKGDPLHLRQVLGNMLASAIKVTSGGGLGLLCTFERGVPPMLDLEFRITDRGGGMNTEELASLFPPESEDEETAAPGPGDGFVLNLAVTRKLARLMKGDLQIQTVPHGPGNSIMLRLPFLEADASELKDDPMPLSGDGKKPADGKPLANIRILLVEDNLINQQIAQEILAGFGAEVHTASNGVEALALLETMPQTQACHLVLMDLQMPEMDGLETTRRIRLDKRFSQLPVIAMTAQTHDEEWKECADAGMDDFVSKPIDVPGLLATVLKWAPGGTKDRE